MLEFLTPLAPVLCKIVAEYYRTRPSLIMYHVVGEHGEYLDYDWESIGICDTLEAAVRLLLAFQLDRHKHRHADWLFGKFGIKEVIVNGSPPREDAWQYQIIETHEQPPPPSPPLNKVKVLCLVRFRAVIEHYLGMYHIPEIHVVRERELNRLQITGPHCSIVEVDDDFNATSSIFYPVARWKAEIHDTISQAERAAAAAAAKGKLSSSSSSSSSSCLPLSRQGTK